MLWSVALLPLLCALVLYRVRAPAAMMAAFSAAVALLTLLLATAAIAGGWGGSYRWSSLIELRLTLSSAGTVFALTVPLVAAPILAYTGLHEPGATAAERRALARLLALMVAFLGAMELLVLADDLLTLLIAWELVGACSWALIAHEWTSVANVRDAGWAFLVTRFGDLGLYAAAAILFAGTGSFAYGAIAQLPPGSLELLAAGVVLAAAAKSAQVPFAPWLFAAMAGPTPVSALLHAATMVAAGVFLIARLHPHLSEASWFGAVAVAVGLITALAAGLVAVFQNHAKKLLAASTSAHYGLMWVAVGAGYPFAALLHFVGHALFKAPLFLATGTVERRAGSYDLAAMQQVASPPGLATATAVASLALAGVFPLGAAWTKEQTMAASGHFAVWAAAIMALAGGLSALYATRLQLRGFGLPPRRPRGGTEMPAEGRAIYALSVLTLLLSLLWWPGVAEALASWLDMHVVPTKPWELVLSFALVAMGIALGVRGVRGYVPIRQGRAAAAIARWWGIPALASAAILAPARAFTGGLARFDDGVLDRAVGAGTRVEGLATMLARFDDGVVDAGLRATARFGTWLALINARRGEGVFDGAVTRSADGVERGGRMARALQTGLVHQYYTLMALGLGILLLLLVLGGLP